MMADHGDPCDDLDATYCMNGGTCYRILSVDILSCICTDSYKGSRCEQFQLFSSTGDALGPGLIAAVVIIVILVLVMLGVVIYFTCKKLRAKPKSQPSTEYSAVQPRV